MKRETIYKILVRRYVEDKASDKEKEVFFHLLAHGKLDKHLHSAMEAGARKVLGEQEAPEGEPTPGFKRFSTLRLRRLAAAVFIGSILISTAFWWRKDKKLPETPVIASTFKNEVAPGGNHALLTLANGSTIALDNAGKDNLGIQGNARVMNIGAGNLVYKATAGKPSAVCYNTIITPAGGQYRVTLSDGTQVWLNALSTLKFPTSLNGADRTVQLTGEAYFEVAKNKSSPFHVKVAGVDVAVLGTSFNVNAYTDEASLKTTLLEGSVRLNKGGESLMLSPGQQGRTGAENGFSLVTNADVGQAVAWKNGYFSFDDVDIRTVMRQLARWYGIQVNYEGTPTRAQFWGKMGRDLNLTQVLTGLTKSKVHFKLDGNTLTVLP
jgi:transmembrane sensor